MDLTRNVISGATLTASATNEHEWHTDNTYSQLKHHTTHARMENGWHHREYLKTVGEQAAKLQHYA